MPFKHLQEFGNERNQRIDGVVRNVKNNHRQRQRRVVLLSRQIAVNGHEHVKLSGGLREQLAVGEVAPTHLSRGPNQVADEQPCEWPGHAMVEQ